MINETVPEGFQKTEVGIIPKDWNIKSISDVAFVISGGTPSTFNNSYWNGNINWFTPTEVGTTKYLFESKRKITKNGLDNSSAKILPIGTVVLTSRASIGDLGVLKREATTNQGFQSLIAKEGFNNEYLYYLLLIFKNKLLQNASGSTFLEISPNKIRAIQIPIPPTKAEQTLIATTLNDADALITGLEKLIAKKRAVKQGAMQELLKPKDEWTFDILGNLANVTKLAGFEYSKYFNSYKDIGEIIVIRGTNITNNKLNLSDVKTIPYATSKNLQRSKLNKNDLVFAYVGTIGPVCLIEENDKYHLGPNTSKITVKNSLIPQYLLLYFKSTPLKNEMFEKISVGAQPSLSMSKIRSFKVYFPKSKTEQTRIAKILSAMDAEIEAIEKKLEKYKQIKIGMMQNLLTGKIRLI